jgi:hypothetical protein
MRLVRQAPTPRGGEALDGHLDPGPRQGLPPAQATPGRPCDVEVALPAVWRPPRPLSVPQGSVEGAR